MPITLSCQDARRWRPDDPHKHAILSLYGDLVIPGPDAYLDNNQHDYDELPTASIRQVLGEVADAKDALGVFLDVEPRVIDGTYVYSVNRLADAVRSQCASLVERFAGHAGIVNAIDSGRVAVSDAEYPVARLVGNVVNVAEHPVGGAPVLLILW